MSDVPDNMVLALLRRMDTKLDRIGSDVHDLKQRMTSAERQIGELRVDVAGVPARLDRIDLSVERIERRLDLAEA